MSFYALSDIVVWIVLIILLACIPAILSLFLIRKAKQRFNRRMRTIRHRYLHHRSLDALPPPESPPYPPRYIGDITCRYNARSPYLRCAINPCGPCEGCSSYEKR